jgi:hypothetical protein
MTAPFAGVAEAPRPFIFDVPAQHLRANDRILKSAMPELHLATVLYVRSHRNPEGAPAPYAPVTVTTLEDRVNVPGEEDAPATLPWGSRVTVERIPDPADNYFVSALEPITESSRLTVQTISELEVKPPVTGSVPAGVIVERLLTKGGGSILDDAPRYGEVIGAWWYVDGRRIETPLEHSAREAADLFADHVVKLRPAGSDAGETCPTCGRIISWLDHLPPTRRGELAICRAAGRRSVSS